MSPPTHVIQLSFEFFRDNSNSMPVKIHEELDIHSNICILYNILDEKKGYFFIIRS